MSQEESPGEQLRQLKAQLLPLKERLKQDLEPTRQRLSSLRDRLREQLLGKNPGLDERVPEGGGEGE